MKKKVVYIYTHRHKHTPTIRSALKHRIHIAHSNHVVIKLELNGGMRQYDTIESVQHIQSWRKVCPIIPHRSITFERIGKLVEN